MLFARGGSDSASRHVQALTEPAPGAALPVAGRTGDVRTAPVAGLAVLTRARGADANGELVLTRFAPNGTGERVLAQEWAWDFALRADGAAVAFVAGREVRELWVARAPEWIAQVQALPGNARPSEPCWLADGSLAICLENAAGSELVALGGGARVLHRAVGGVLTMLCALPDSGIAFVETPRSPEAAPGRVLRLSASGGQPAVLATGFFRPGTLAVSTEGAHVGVVRAETLAALRTGAAAWRWLGATPAGWPNEIAGVTAAVWSPDGRRLAVARQTFERRWIEVYGAAIPPVVLGFAGAPCFGPQWWPVAP